MNANKESEATTTQLFLRMEADLNAAQAMELSQSKVDHLEKVIRDAKTIIKQLSLFGGAMYTAFGAIRNIVGSLREKNPAVYAEMQRWLGRILGRQDIFEVFYGEETKFCTAFEGHAEFCQQYQRAFQKMTVAEAGVNQEAGKIAADRLRKVASLTHPAGAGN